MYNCHAARAQAARHLGEGDVTRSVCDEHTRKQPPLVAREPIRRESPLGQAIPQLDKVIWQNYGATRPIVDETESGPLQEAVDRGDIVSDRPLRDVEALGKDRERDIVAHAQELSDDVHRAPVHVSAP